MVCDVVLDCSNIVVEVITGFIFSQNGTILVLNVILEFKMRC